MASSKRPNKNLLEASYTRFLMSDDSWIHSIYTKIFGGMVVGGLLVSVPLFYGGINSVEQLSSLQLCLIFLVMQSCILLTVKLGDKFVDALVKGLDNLAL